MPLAGALPGLRRRRASGGSTRETLADPEGSILTHYIKTGEVSEDVGSWFVEGIGEDFLPPVADFSHTKQAYTISDGEAFDVARELLRVEGILAGSSSGTLIAAALKYCRAQTEPKNVVTFVCDRGDKYLSKVYNDYWMQDNGFLAPPQSGDLRDLIARKHELSQVITIQPQTPLAAAYRQMKLYEISQLPVMSEDGELVGLMDEEDLLAHVFEQRGSFEGLAEDIMAQDLRTLGLNASEAEVMALLQQGFVVPIVEAGRFYGIITKIDMLNHMRLAQG